jgi:AcrR family transcriptional regulator
MSPSPLRHPPASEAATPPRERILSTARTLFYRHGIHGIGVDAIAEAAGTNKMTLYRHFASKDLLIAECLRQLAGEIDAAFEAIVKAHPGDPKGQLLAWLGHIGEFKLTDRGCAFANAAVELPDKDHPAKRVIDEHKSHGRQRLTGLCREAGLAEPELLADKVFLLCEGARISMQSCSDGPACRLPILLQSLVAEHDLQRRTRGDDEEE